MLVKIETEERSDSRNFYHNGKSSSKNFAIHTKTAENEADSLASRLANSMAPR
jgi:hypothetical protein